MSFEDDEQLLEEYVEWSVTKKASGLDISPGAFLINRAESAAFNKVEEVISFIKFYDHTGKTSKTLAGQLLQILES